MKTAGSLLLLLLLTTFAYAKEVEKKTFEATVNEDGVQVVDIFGGEYFFDPNYIIVKVNTPVKLIVKKDTIITPHNILMDSPDAGMKFSLALDNDGEAVEFTPTMTGEYKFYCNKKLLFMDSHEEKGMKGTIVVVE